jgi:hypothetical protein
MFLSKNGNFHQHNTCVAIAARRVYRRDLCDQADIDTAVEAAAKV